MALKVFFLLATIIMATAVHMPWVSKTQVMGARKMDQVEVYLGRMLALPTENRACTLNFCFDDNGCIGGGCKCVIFEGGKFGGCH